MSRSVLRKASVGVVVTLAILAAVVGFPLMSAASPSHAGVYRGRTQQSIDLSRMTFHHHFARSLVNHPMATVA